MAYPNGGVPVWFGVGRRKDAERLLAWQDAPLTYISDQEIGPNWNVDRYEVILGTDPTGELFWRAAALTLHNLFYPPQVMTAVSQYSLAGRPVQTGDRVLQRILIFEWLGMPILEVLTMNEITEVINEPRRVGFTYTTTAAHSEIGEWSPSVTWRENNEVVLLIEVASSARPGASDYSRRFARKMQLRAHKLSIDSFKALLFGQPRSIRMAQPHPARQQRAAPALLPVAMLVVGVALFLGKVISYLD